MPRDPSSGKTALVLAGGGSLGAVQVGMLRALVAHGLSVDLVVGSSVGAINGAYFAGDPTPQGVARLEAIWRSLRRDDVFPVTWRTLLGFLRRRDFLVTSDGIRALIEKNLPYRNLEEARIPLHVVATDILSGDAVCLSRGPAAEAILASSAIPAAFPPVPHQGCFLADAAITSNTPVKLAIARGARRLIVLPTGFTCALRAPPKGALANALHALTLLIARQMIAELESVGPDVVFHVVPPLCPLGGSPYDFSQTAMLIERAANSTADWLAGGGMERCEIPGQLRAHKHDA